MERILWSPRAKTPREPMKNPTTGAVFFLQPLSKAKKMVIQNLIPSFLLFQLLTPKIFPVSFSSFFPAAALAEISALSSQFSAISLFLLFLSFFSSFSFPFSPAASENLFPSFCRFLLLSLLFSFLSFFCYQLCSRPSCCLFFLLFYFLSFPFSAASFALGPAAASFFFSRSLSDPRPKEILILPFTLVLGPFSFFVFSSILVRVSQLPYGDYSHVVHGLSDNMRLMYK
jgi:hypothetical protein